MDRLKLIKNLKNSMTKIFFFMSYYFIVGITNSGSDLIPEGHLDVNVFSLV